MAYNPMIPAAGDLLSQSQADLQANFIAINAFVDPNTGEVKLAMVLDTNADPATGAAQVGLYQKLGATSGVPELTFRRANSGTVIPFTESVNANPGWTRLPSGMVLQWGVTNVTNPATPRAFNVAFSTACVSVQLTEQLPNVGAITRNWVGIVNGSLTPTTFTPQARDGNGNLATANIYYFAVGY